MGVWSNGCLVGVISYEKSAETFSFAYAAHWLKHNKFPLSPRLKAGDLDSQTSALELRWFLENLLPEGQALDDVVGLHQLSKANLFGLMRVLGKESTGALAFLPAEFEPENIPTLKREISFPELNARIHSREQIPFSVWDGKVRMSIAGYQDKIAVYREPGGGLFLVEGALASTHILKPVPKPEVLKHMVINEYFCMILAKQAGLDAANVELLRVPDPVLLIERFDRVMTADKRLVERLHVIDACQALGMPPSYKYERTLGNGADVQHVRDGVSLPKLFALLSLADNKAAETRKLLSWVIFQYLIGNVDAHGKNISYFVDAEGIRLAPMYDLVAGEMHDCFAHDIGMGIADEFHFNQVRAFDWAEFGCLCGIKRTYLVRELRRLAKAVDKAVDLMPVDEICIDADEQNYLQKLIAFIKNRALLLLAAKLMPAVDDELLSRPWRA